MTIEYKKYPFTKPAIELTADELSHEVSWRKGNRYSGEYDPVDIMNRGADLLIQVGRTLNQDVPHSFPS